MAWEQLELESPHIAYACVGVFCTLFSLVSLFVKERLYIGEATVATIAGLILGPHCLNWFNPISWGNSDYITLEICRIVLCIQIIAVAVELPRKYMKKHWISVAIFLLPVMTVGWLVVGLFIWCLIPHFSFNDGLLVSACVTATDPVLAAAVVGKGKFAERVPGHLRNLLSAESGCNDGMAFPFIYLALNLIIHSGHGGLIVKDWFLLTILWECFFGCFLGSVMGWSLRKVVAFAENKNLIDRESFLAIFIFLAFNCAGIGSILGVDDLLVSFAAGTAFGWNGDFANKTEESHVSTVIDLLLNLSFFVYFGAIIPWPEFNNIKIGLNVWRLIILALVIIFLRRVPAVVILKPITPDVKTWREAFFCGHFGPIGVGALFASILARKDLEGHYTTEETPLHKLPNEEFPHYQLLSCIWPIVCFIVVTSIIVHGSSVAVLTLGKRLNRMAITMSFTTTNGDQTEGGGGGSNWMQRLQNLDRTNTSFSLHRVDTMTPTEKAEIKRQQKETLQNIPETSGVKVRPAGGAKRRKKKIRKRSQPGLIKKTLSRVKSNDDEEMEERHRPTPQFLQLGGRPQPPSQQQEPTSPTTPLKSTSSSEPEATTEVKTSSSSGETSPQQEKEHIEEAEESSPNKKTSGKSKYGEYPKAEKRSIPTIAYQDGDQIIIEDQHGEVMDNLTLNGGPKNKKEYNGEDDSIHSMESLRRHLSQYSSGSGNKTDNSSINNEKQEHKKESLLAPLERKLSRKSYYKKDDPHRRKVYAHRVDNLIVIENEDGDIIRRYKVNRHASVPHQQQKEQQKLRSRSSTFVDKIKSLVGIKPNTKSNENYPNQDQSSPSSQQPQEIPTVHVTDLEKGTHHNIIIPQDDKKLHPHHDKIDKIEDKIASILETKHRKGSHHLIKKASPPPPPGNNHALDEEDIGEADEEPSYEDEITTDDNNEELDESDEDEETEVEKRRRLQALGKLPNKNRDNNDEE
ncbi:CNH1 [Candida pseudojiufengensis]|uniref:CNH1 n=1 Tax=Candida pseudojiufengensis TaxID=497109 RepID=UPI002224BF60|nr:CNH1 [Candida pseudojiufengensis]KAI5965634.1 CNH1 [Candida pseudojiufengensis]